MRRRGSAFWRAGGEGPRGIKGQWPTRYFDAHGSSGEKILIRNFCVGLLVFSASALAVTDSLTISEKAGVTTTNYPIQFARPFMPGEIANFPQVLVDGNAVPTQADVKQRYADGSVKHAIVSFLIPTLTANAVVTITFQNQQSENSTALTASQMLDPAENFEATMQLAAPNCSSCSVQTVSARNMLTAGAYSYWTSGPIATTIILADHTTKAFDLGWQNIMTTTVAGTLAPNATTLQVANASGWTAPMLLRINNTTTDTYDNTAAEDVQICAINTSVTPHQATIGVPGNCPSVSGRGTPTMKWTSGAPVFPNIWAAAPSNNYKSVRPIIHATFWPGANKIRVRFIGEDADTEKLQDQIYSLALSLGYASPATVYTNPQVAQRAATRWTKEFWIGGQPSQIEINHNFAYLIATKFIYNFDTTKSLTFSSIQQTYNAWIASPRDLYQPGTMVTAMGTTGLTDHTGYITGWATWWLYTMDYRAWQMAHESADLGGAWLFHMREGNSAKNITRSAGNGCSYVCSEPGLGRIMAVTNRTSVTSRDLKRTDRAAGDEPTIVGGYSNNNWTLGLNHGWDPYSTVYAVTGDFWYLEEAWFWAGFGSAYSLGPTSASGAQSYMRGPTGAEGVLPSEQCYFSKGKWISNGEWQDIRVSAWTYRSVVNTAFMSPDNTAEASYFGTLVVDAIAAMEGWHTVSPSVNAPWYQAIWNWGATVQNNQCGISPLHMHSRGEPGLAQSDPYYGINTATTTEANMYGINYMMFGLTRAAELGYPATAMAQWEGQFYVNLVTQPASNPYLLLVGRMPTIKASGHTWIDNWADYVKGYLPQWGSQLTSYTNSGWVYQFEGMVAVGNAHQVTQSSTSQQAWNFVQTNLLDAFSFTNNQTNIRYAIVPRVAGAASASSSTSACDLNGDGVVNILDVELAIQAELGNIPCTASSGICNAAYVNQIINAALGLGCMLGP